MSTVVVEMLSKTVLKKLLSNLSLEVHILPIYSNILENNHSTKIISNILTSVFYASVSNRKLPFPALGKA